jgi:hypothetical protein
MKQPKSVYTTDPLTALRGMVEADEYAGVYHHDPPKMKAPTLCDALIREYMRPFYKGIANTDMIIKPLRESRKFVLDETMSAFMADLSYASLLTTDKPHKAQLLTDAMRMAARLPHKVTWIEYNHFLRSKRAVEEYQAALDISRGVVPERGGWLCIQHPDVETAYMAIHAVSNTWRGERMIDQPAMMYLCYVWRSDDGPLPWPNYDLSMPFAKFARADIGEVTPAGILTGVVNYKSASVGLIRNQQFTAEQFDFMMNKTQFNPVAEIAGDLRYLWALLCTIDDLPTSTADVRATKGFVARGAYRRFQDHKVIHLHVPEKKYRRTAVHAIAITRRKAHQVRGHWRKDFRRPLLALCEHEWSTPDEKILECKLCGGRKLHVKEHMRGDPELGVVTHDYKVERDDPRFDS